MRLGVIVMVLVASFVACGAELEPALQFDLVRSIELPSEGPRSPAPRGITLGAGGERIVLDNTGRILVYDSAGRFSRSWRMPRSEIGNPEGICRLRDGRIAVADTHYHRIIIFGLDVREFETIGCKGIGPLEFIYPACIVQGDDGCIYVAEYGGNDRIQKLSETGEFLCAFGSFGSGLAQLQRPSGMVWHAGRLYVADAMNQRIVAFDDDGGKVSEIASERSGLTLRYPYDLCLSVDGETLYVAEFGGGRLTAMTTGGHLVGRWTGDDRTRLRTPWGLAVDAHGTLMVTDTGNHRLIELVGGGL